MDISGLSFELANIVMLFQNLKSAKVSRDSILGLYENSRPEHFDVGPLFVVRHPGQKIEIYVFIDENRVETKILNPSNTDWTELPKVAFKVFHAIDGAPLAAFGFNYFAEVPLPQSQDGDQFLIDKFDASLKPLAQQVGGKIFSIASTVKYSKNEETHELRIGTKAGNAKILSLRLNVHYNKAQLFAERDLIEKYSVHKDNFIETIKRLFN